MLYVEQCPVCGSDKLKENQALVMPFVSQRIGAWTPFVVSKDYFKDLVPGISYLSTFTCECQECGLVFGKHRFNEAEMALMYHDYRGEEYTRQRRLYEPGYDAVNDYLGRQVAHLGQIESLIFSCLNTEVDFTVLDWGGGTGLNTPLASRASALVIYDIDKQPNFRTISGEYCDGMRFDVVSCMHVLEHLPYPSRTLAAMRDVMREDAILYVEVPLDEFIDFPTGGVARDRIKLHWHEHINSFSRRSLETLLTLSGLAVLHLDTLNCDDEFRRFSVIQCLAKKVVTHPPKDMPTISSGSDKALP